MAAKLNTKTQKFSHIDPSGNPTMVDVSEKQATLRVALAEAIVEVGEDVTRLITKNDLITKKGSVFQTAIIAGVMASKRTSDLIPLCHPLQLEDCKITITSKESRIFIKGEARLFGKTGVEMEALTAVSVAALTVYDMCKALSHDITIKEIRLLEKRGGKSDYKRKK